MQVFRPVNRRMVNMFTCGPSVYQRAHIGNFRTFLFEDVLARYLQYLGYSVRRGMNLTDIEDKSIHEANRKGTTLARLTEQNIKEFLREMGHLRMKTPDYLPKASECVDDAVKLIEHLLKLGIAYRHSRNIYFEPAKFHGFGKLYGLDMTRWPSRKKRFHKDTYPGMQWNLGDFILWHGYKPGDKYYWDTTIGRGRPSWNIQDPSIISKYFTETLSIYCGGIDNLFRHHDYTLAILESVRPFPMAKFWLHCNHLYVNGQKMSKSKGNILYVDTLRKHYDYSEIRFFLVYNHYRERLSYSDTNMQLSAEKLRTFRHIAKKISRKAEQTSAQEGEIAGKLRRSFRTGMDDDLNLKESFDDMHKILTGINIDMLSPADASGIIATLQKADEVLKVVF